MTERKNVTLPEPYDEMFRDLDARNEFTKAYGSFSEFVQAQIEEFHDNPDRVRAEHHRQEEKKHRQLRENFEEKADVDIEENEGELEKQEEIFFEEFLDRMQEKKGGKEWHKNPEKVYKQLESGWIRKYATEFSSISEKNFRAKVREYIGLDALEDLGLVATIED